LDMALGDELGPKRSALGYLTGVLYDPGSYASFKTRRERRNYLQVAIRSTYLALEGYGVARVRKALPRWMPECEPRAADHAIQRAFRLDDLFIYVTNPEWQKKNFKTVEKFLRKASRKTRATFHLSESADDWIAPYLAVEKIFDRFGI